MKKKQIKWLIIILGLIIIAGALILLFSCIKNKVKISKISNFQECIDAGFPAMESYPRQCNDGTQTYVEEICLNNCGNSVCEEVVCLSPGCPCPETADSCEVDCGVE